MNSIERQFNLVAEEYDRNRKKFIPCFDAYYVDATAFAASSIKTPSRIFDLGSGTGLLAQFWYRHFPDAEYVLVNIADEMLSVARKRFSSAGNVSCEIMDYKSRIPSGNCDAVISALSIHRLEDIEKQIFSSGLSAFIQADGFNTPTLAS